MLCDAIAVLIKQSITQAIIAIASLIMLIEIPPSALLLRQIKGNFYAGFALQSYEL